MIERGFVYFVTAVGCERPLIKVGYSRKPLLRAEALAAWSPFPLTILAAVPGTRHDERAVHFHFIGSWFHREWFRSDFLLRRFIEQVIEVQRLPSLPPAPPNWRLPHQRNGAGNTARTANTAAARAASLRARARRKAA